MSIEELELAFDVTDVSHRRRGTKVYYAYYDADIMQRFYLVAESKPEAVKLAREYGKRVLHRNLWLLYYDRLVGVDGESRQVGVLDLDKDINGNGRK